jgi:Sporulation and spore germination
MDRPHDSQPDDDPLARQYRELGGLGARSATPPDLGDLLRRDRQHERRRVAGTAVAVVSTMGVAAWAGTTLFGAGHTFGPQTLPAAPVAASTLARHSGPVRTSSSTAERATPSSPASIVGSGAATMTPVIGTPEAAGSPQPSGASVAAGPTRTVQVWFETTTLRSDGCHALRAVARQVPTDDPVSAAVHELLQGPTKSEQQAGLRSDFGPGVAAAATVTHAGGTVVVDFGGLGRLSSVSPTCRRSQVASPLNQTLAQFSSVKTKVYTLKGDAAAFRAYVTETASPSASG